MIIAVQDGEDVSQEFVPWQFWVYIGVFALTLLFSANYQKKYERNHEELYEYADDYRQVDELIDNPNKMY